jgi:hypothetical protein
LLLINEPFACFVREALAAAVAAAVAVADGRKAWYLHVLDGHLEEAWKRHRVSKYNG